MNKIVTQISIDVYPDPDYYFRVVGPGDLMERELILG